jgi:hypothetical protein
MFIDHFICGKTMILSFLEFIELEIAFWFAPVHSEFIFSVIEKVPLFANGRVHQDQPGDGSQASFSMNPRFEIKVNCASDGIIFNYSYPFRNS